MRAPLDLQALDLATLARFYAAAFDDQVLTTLTRGGFPSLRMSDGFVVQHLLKGPHSVTELAGLLEVSQQAVSKRLAELETLGLLERLAGRDGRVKRVQLSKRGEACVQASRAQRAKLEKVVRAKVGHRAVDEARRSLVRALEALGAGEPVRHRRVVPER
jgi:DNA-binding MarR family transcriptional regulator